MRAQLGISEEGGPKLSSFLAALIVFLTIVLVLVAGIGLSYLTVTQILRAFGHRPRKPAAALTTAEAGSGGD